MIARFTWLAGAAAALLHTQGTTPKEKAADYPVRSPLSGFQIAAEYLVHSLPMKAGVINVGDYLVLEVAIYPEPRATPTVTSGEFTLRLTLVACL